MPNSSTKARSVSDLLAAATAPAPSTRKPRAKHARQPRIPKPVASAPPLVTPLPGERVDAPTKAAINEIPVAVEIHLPPPYPWQQMVWTALHAGYRVVACVTAQQIGKTSLGIEWLIEGGLAGERCWWVAPDYSLTEPGYDMFAELFSQPPFNQVVDKDGHKMVEENKKRQLFTFRNNGRVGTIQIKSADDPNKLRGKTLHRLVADECGYMHPDAWHANLIHRLTVFRGIALLISNPVGKNWLWDVWRLGDPDNPHRDPDYASFQFDQSANPNISREEMEKKKLHMPYRQYQREVLGMFTDDGGDVFLGVKKAASILPNLPPLCVYNPSHRYVAGMDISAGRQDFTVIIVFDVNEMAQAAMYRFSEPELSGHVRILQQVNDYWKPDRIEIEENSQAMFAVPEFRNIGLPVQAWNNNWKTKGELIQAYAAAIELGRIRLLQDADLIKEHEGMESDVAPGGTIRYHSPRNGHDDIVIASALAYRAATVHDASAQPSFVRGVARNLYGNSVPVRQYPSWTQPSNVNRSSRNSRRSD